MCVCLFACVSVRTRACVCVCVRAQDSVCVCAYACAMGLFDVVVLVHFKGKALMRILQNSRGRGGGYSQEGWGLNADWHS